MFYAMNEEKNIWMVYSEPGRSGCGSVGRVWDGGTGPEREGERGGDGRGN